MAQTLEEYYKSLSGIYDPQRQLINTQMAQLPQQYQAQTSALEQAKVNAFRDIANQSSARGAGWSGFRPGEELRYTGATYLPALANLKTAQTNQQNSLLQSLNEINANQSSTARGYYETAVQGEQQRAYEAQQLQAKQAYEAQQAEIDRQFKAQQASLDRSASASSSQASAAEERQRAINAAVGYLGQTFVSGKGTARFYLYDDKGKPIKDSKGNHKYKTREQAARDLQAQTGLTYAEALAIINQNFKTAEGR